MARYLLPVLLLAALLVPSSAQAGAGAPAQPRHAHAPVRLALGTAERYWHAVPCGGQIAIRTDRRLVHGLDHSTDAWVTFDSSLGANDPQAPAESYSECVISFARWQWPTQRSMAGDWNMFCLTMVHELGHLLGHPHSLAPGSVMAPVFSNESDVPAICRTTAPRRAS